MLATPQAAHTSRLCQGLAWPSSGREHQRHRDSAAAGAALRAGRLDGMTFCGRTSWTLMFPPVSGLRGRLGSRSRLALLCDRICTAADGLGDVHPAVRRAGRGVALSPSPGDRERPAAGPSRLPTSTRLCPREQNRFLSYDTTLVWCPRICGQATSPATTPLMCHRAGRRPRTATSRRFPICCRRWR